MLLTGLFSSLNLLSLSGNSFKCYPSFGGSGRGIQCTLLTFCIHTQWISLGTSDDLVKGNGFAGTEGVETFSLNGSKVKWDVIFYTINRNG